LTETAGAAATVTHNCFSLEHAGKAAKHVEIILDEPDEGGTGEILVRGRLMMMGYFKDAEATK